MHRPASAAAIAGLASQQLRVHATEVGALRDAMPVTSVGRRDPVVVPQMRAHAGGDAFLAGVGMDRAPELAFAEQHCGGLLEVADAPHHAVEIERGRLVHQLPSTGCSITRIAPSRRSVNVAHASPKRPSGKARVPRGFTSTCLLGSKVSARPDTPFGFASDPSTSMLPRTIVERSTPESSVPTPVA